MRILERAGLLSRIKVGRKYYCRLAPKRLEQAQEWIEQHCALWNERLDNLEKFLAQTEQKTDSSKKINRIKTDPRALWGQC
jgi:glutamyl/glutaminyl-tRNA synthetase